MGPIFSDAVAESRESFLNLVRNTTATFYEVYSGAPNSGLEEIFHGICEGEAFLRFDMTKHSGEARSRFCRLSDLERRAYGFPDGTAEKPLPYFGAFVPGIGHTGIAWTSGDVRALISRTRQDESRAKEVSRLIEAKNQKPGVSLHAALVVTPETQENR